MAMKYNFKVEELIETGRTTRYHVEGMKEWLELVPTIPPLVDEQIAVFLLACNNDMEATKSCIVSYFKYKAAAPEIFSDRDIDGPEMSETLRVTNAALFPRRTAENYAIVMVGLKDTSYSSFNLDSQVKMLYTYLDALLYENPPDGLVALIDIKGVGLMHLTRLKPGTVKKFFQFLQEALPMQLRRIHVLNTSYIFEKIMLIFRPFMSKELFDMIVTHQPNVEMEEFYKHHLARGLLPSDFGGDLPNLEQLADETRAYCRRVRGFLEACEQQVEIYKENRR